MDGFIGKAMIPTTSRQPPPSQQCVSCRKGNSSWRRKFVSLEALLEKNKRQTDMVELSINDRMHLCYM